jgi:hypothetical protein
MNPSQHTGNGSDVGNGMIAGIIFKPDGKTAAAGAKVFLRKKQSLADTMGILAKKSAAADTATSITDENGKFVIDSVDTGVYVIESSDGNNNLAFKDSVFIVETDTTIIVPPDTLKPAGALKGVIRLSEGGDPRKVFVLAFGIDRFARVNEDGSFRFTMLAEGKYDLRIIASLDDYGVLDTLNIPVNSADTTNLGTVELPFTGIPTPKGTSVSYDTMKQIVTLSWSKADTALVNGYYVYRRNVDSNTVFSRINAPPVTDTVYRDSTGMQDQSYEYRVSAIDKNTTEGVKSASVSVKVVGAFTLTRMLGTSGNGIGQYSKPAGISLSDNGSIFIADFDSGRVLLYDADGVFQRNYSGFNSPRNVVAAQNGSFYVVEYGTKLIKLIDSSGQTLSQFGGNGAQDGKFADISPCFFIYSKSKLYIPDYGNNRIQIFDAIGTYLLAIPISVPWSITIVSDSNLVVGSDLKVSILNTNGTSVSEWLGVYSFISATTKNGNVVIITNELEGNADIVKIAFYSPQGSQLAKFGVSNQNRNNEMFFEAIWGIAIDNSNNLYVVDSGQKMIKVFALPSGL